MIGAVDELASTARPGAGNDLLRVCVKNLGSALPTIASSGQPQARGVRTAIVVIVSAVFVHVSARGKYSRGRADGDRQ